MSSQQLLNDLLSSSQLQLQAHFGFLRHYVMFDGLDISVRSALYALTVLHLPSYSSRKWNRNFLKSFLVELGLSENLYEAFYPLTNRSSEEDILSTVTTDSASEAFLTILDNAGLDRIDLFIGISVYLRFRLQTMLLCRICYFVSMRWGNQNLFDAFLYRCHTLCSGHYGAHGRVLFRNLIALVPLSQAHRVAIEMTVQEDLQHAADNISSSTVHTQSDAPAPSKTMRYLKWVQFELTRPFTAHLLRVSVSTRIGTAAVLTGAVLAVTGGLAAPAMAGIFYCAVYRHTQNICLWNVTRAVLEWWQIKLEFNSVSS